MQFQDSFYLNKYSFKEPQIREEVSLETGIIVTIPCYNEPNLIPSLEALWNCETPECHVEVLVIINASEASAEDVKTLNISTWEEASEWATTHEKKSLRFHFLLENDLPKKHAGVGLARKILMDEASWRFESIGKLDGIISCFDADSLCDSNYLIELEKHFKNYPKSEGCSIHFEHPTEGLAYSEEIYNGIAEYELHLRYYRQAIKFTGHPAAFHTIGSSMAVRARAYQKQGGMNKRKAGEDFYFLQKIISLGNFSELNSTRIIPSPRPSDRVPFGTGRAIGEWLENKPDNFQTYNFQSFIILKEFFNLIEAFQNSTADYHSLSEEMKHFLNEEEFNERLVEIRRQSTNKSRFIQRFYFWFDAFKILKFVHFMRDHHFPNESVISQSVQFLDENKIDYSKFENNPVDYLSLFRLIDQKVIF